MTEITDASRDVSAAGKLITQEKIDKLVKDLSVRVPNLITDPSKLKTPIDGTTFTQEQIDDITSKLLLGLTTYGGIGLSANQLGLNVRACVINVKEPLVLKQGELEYKLKFNCKPCEMEIWEKDAEFEIEEDHFH